MGDSRGALDSEVPLHGSPTKSHGQGLAARGLVRDGFLMWNHKLSPNPSPCRLHHNLWLQPPVLLEKQDSLRAQPLPL